MASNLLLWGGFVVFILAILAIDLGLFHRDQHIVTTKEATTWTIVWVTLALLFNAGLWYFQGFNTALEFFTGYVIEYSLSVDNIFVFIMLFAYFQVPALYRHRVLFWGILGALIFRAALIAVGAALITQFHWVIYIFGAFLIFSGIKMATASDEGEEPGSNPLVRIFTRFFPVTDKYHKERFFIRAAGRWVATPLFIVLLVVETTDIMFALDSIPAIFAVTQDPFIVFSSNVFAILGLRSLYFLLDGVMGLFRFLKIGLAFVLSFVGAKMLLSFKWHIDTLASLGVVVGILAVSIIASLLFKAKPEDH